MDELRLIQIAYLTPILLTILFIWYGVRRAKAAERRSIELDKTGRWLCPRCNSRAVDRLPPDNVSRHPGYACRACGLRMRPRNSTAKWLVVLVFSLLVCAVCLVAICLKPVEFFRLLGIAAAMAVLAVCTVLQLRRPMPVHVDDAYPESSDSP
jgi:hypothetical protein